MNTYTIKIGDLITIELPDIQQLLDALIRRGYKVIGPVTRDGVVLYDELTSVTDLPVGWTDEQSGGIYRLKKRSDEALFGYSVGPHSWKKFLNPPHIRLWQVKRNGNGYQFITERSKDIKFAFIGVRSCELSAIKIQDEVFINGKYSNPLYSSRRANAFIVAVNCGRAGGTCFCASMNAGPKVTSGFDLSLTEVLDNEKHYFVVEVGTDRGTEILGEVRYEIADEQQIAKAEEIVAMTAERMGRKMPESDIKDLLYRNYEHPRWDEVAQRCLTCGNCTMACPTCFCSTVEDVTDLKGENAERWQRWDSCFTMDFSYIHGGSVRITPKSRYRQWITHKLATWIDQFGTSGCVGCGRCITWCPVGIDITEEVRTILESEKSKKENTHGDQYT
jgi:sulfhydrogenase subunit beta (sulfur reductase)